MSTVTRLATIDLMYLKREYLENDTIIILSAKLETLFRDDIYKVSCNVNRQFMRKGLMHVYLVATSSL